MSFESTVPSSDGTDPRLKSYLRRERQQQVAGAEAEILRSAASILVKRSRKPRAVGLRIVCKVLRDVADQLEAKPRT